MKHLSNLPSHWKTVMLGEVFDFSNGINFSADQKGRGVLTVDVLNMYLEGLYVKTNNLYRVDVSLKNERLLKSGDILFVRSSVKEEGVGWAAIFQGRDEPVTYCGFIIRGRERQNQNIIDSRFLVYYLRQPLVRKQTISSSGKVAITNINQQRLGALQIPLPPLSEQKRIAEVLDKADALREKRRLALQKLDTLLQSVFLEMFGDPVKNPKGWELKPLSDVFNFRTGKLDSNAAVKDGKYPFFTCSRETFEIDTYAFDCEALLLAGNNATADYSVKHYKGKFNAYQRTYVITLLNPSDSYFYMRQLLERKLLELKRISKGTNTKYLTLQILERLKFQVPSPERQKEFEKVNIEINRQVEKQKKSLRTLENLFQSLQQRAFKGELFSNESPAVNPQEEKAWQQTSLF